MRPILRILLISLCAGLAAGNAEQNEANGFPEVKAQLEQAKDRLNLTDEQVEQVKPILRESIEASKQVLDKHGIDLSVPKEQRTRPSFREMRAIKKDMKAVRTATTEKLAVVLSDDQLDAYKEIQEERREEMQEQIRARR